MFSIVVKVHDRLCTLDIMFHSIYKNSTDTHEIILMADKPDDIADPIYNHTGDPNMTMTKWVEEQKKTWLKDKPIKFIRFDDRPGKMDLYRAYNHGFKSHATSDWFCALANCDFYYCPNWDKQIIHEIPKHDYHKHVWVPLYFHSCGIQDENIGYRSYTPLIQLERRIKESDLIQYAESRKGKGTYKEICGERKLTWAPMIIHRDLYNQIGGFTEDPPYPDAQDLHFDDNLRDKLGIYKVGCLESMVYHFNAFRSKETCPVIGE